MKKFIYLILILSVISLCRSGGLAAAICYTGCNSLWVACVSAAGGVAGVSTGGAAVPAAILACNAAQGTCMAACIAALITPTP